MTGSASTPDPATLAARCPACGEELWRERAGQWTLRAAILKLDGDGHLVAKCPQARCRGEVQVPWLALQVPPQLQPPTAPAGRRRIAIRRQVLVGT